MATTHNAPTRTSQDAPDVWFTNPAPGGYGCGRRLVTGTLCGESTESEPCPQHQPVAYAAID